MVYYTIEEQGTPKTRLGTLTPQVPTVLYRVLRVLEPLGPYIVGTWAVRVPKTLNPRP